MPSGRAGVLRGGIVGLCAALLVVVTTTPMPPTPSAQAGSGETCAPGEMPYADLEGANLEPAVHTSNDARPVSYVRWRGTVPGFDGMPFSVDVTVPCDATQPLPTVVMLHGFTDDKTIWQETGKSDSVESADRPESNSYWNNVWFASRGYAVLNYTARGWRDSCGPDTPGATATSPAPQCESFESWIHLDDKRWEVRDAQWLAGGLVQSGVADSDRLAITGGSYGGAPTVSAALLADQVVCGGAGVPPSLGPDPCAGHDDGELAEWTTPDGTTELAWVAAVALYTFGDLIQVLAPNGRASDGWELAPPDGDRTDPFGVPLDSTVNGLQLAAGATGRLADPGGDLDSDIRTTSDRLIAGNPFPQDDPIVAEGVRVYSDLKSPITTSPQGDVPIFWVQGFTDALFPALEAVSVMNEVQRHAPEYPFKLFLGDLGHDYAAQPLDEWELVKDLMNEFLDHFLDPQRTPDPPAFDVTATVTRCLDPGAEMRSVSAPSWHDLHPDHVELTSDQGGETATATPGPAGAATDPITTATLPGPDSYPGCRVMRPSEPDPTVVTYEFDLDEELVLMGGPVVDIDFDATGPDVPLSVRVWDVTADASEQGLVTRGTYRVAEAGAGQNARFQLALQGYELARGHRLKVEVTANDSPYLQASNVDAVVTVTGLGLTLPLLTEDVASDASPAANGGSDSRPVWVWVLVAAAALVALGVAGRLLIRAWR